LTALETYRLLFVFCVIHFVSDTEKPQEIKYVKNCFDHKTTKAKETKIKNPNYEVEISNILEPETAQKTKAAMNYILADSKAESSSLLHNHRNTYHRHIALCK
jgi:hypothetical protein